MSIAVQWDNDDHTAIRWDFDGLWTWNDFFSAYDQVGALLDSVDHTIDMIVNMQNTSLVPGGALSHFKRLARWHPRAGVSVVVGASRFVEIILRLFKKIQREAGDRILTADSIEEARESLCARRMAAEEPELQ